mgnify:CR=1 FL=1
MLEFSVCIFMSRCRNTELPLEDEGENFDTFKHLNAFTISLNINGMFYTYNMFSVSRSYIVAYFRWTFKLYHTTAYGRNM